MISLSTFLDAVEQNAERIHEYSLGHDGSDGKSDCIGLIIGALRLAGEKWPGTHGTNWAARNAIDGLEPISGPGELFLGEIVFKAREPGESGYDLPSAYKDSPDRLDYYHVGVVTSIAPLEITHCTSTPGGIKRDTKQGQWKYGGALRYVNYEESDEPMDEEPLHLATVTAVSGKTVRMRSQPNKNSRVLEEIPLGAVVPVYDVLDGWSKIWHNGKTGYMMSEFLSPLPEDEDNEAAGDFVGVPRAVLVNLLNQVQEVLAVINDLLEE